jgi:hypothetical protein
MTAISEGGYNILGRIFSVDNGIVSKAITNSVYRPIISLRIKANEKIQVYIQAFSAISIAAANIHYEVFIFRDNLNFTLTGAVWTSNPGTNSKIEYDLSATAINFSTYTPISSGYLSKGDVITYINSSEYNNTVLTTNIDGVSDIFCLVAKTFAGGENMIGSIFYKELL